MIELVTAIFVKRPIKNLILDLTSVSTNTSENLFLLIRRCVVTENSQSFEAIEWSSLTSFCSVQSEKELESE